METASRTVFTFDKTFGQSHTTKEVYDGIVENIVASATACMDGTVFTYGQTSSGKTFTMKGSGTIEEGAIDEGGGIMHLAAADIFRHLQNTPGWQFWVTVSFLEVYNEKVRDLLAEGSELQIREGPSGATVKSYEEEVSDSNKMMGILFRGEEQRAFATTKMNERSSRSHTIFRITVSSRTNTNVHGLDCEDAAAEDKENSRNNHGREDGAVLVSTLNLIDLAGSESARNTGSNGEQQKEGGVINKR
jgi:centromeric protein E